MRNLEDLNREIFSKEDIKFFLQVQKEIAVNVCQQTNWENQIEKIMHRIYTCSYDVELVDGMYRLYFCGIFNDGSFEYVEISVEKIVFLFEQIKLCRYGNIEKTDFLDRLINFVCFFYINSEIALLKSNEHEEINRKIDIDISIGEYVSTYMSKVNNCLWYEKPFENLNDIYNRNFHSKIATEIICRYFVKFLCYDKKSYVLGSMLENKYIKFSFSKEKRNEYNRINGRKFYEYKSNSIAEDYIDGCGFSFGDISKCFYYFEDGNYGEQLMFIETLNNEKYYCREYEYLGKKIKINSITYMYDVNAVTIVLKNMSEEAKYYFFNNCISENFMFTFGTVEKTIKKMKEYDEQRKTNNYNDVINLLEHEKLKYVV